MIHKTILQSIEHLRILTSKVGFNLGLLSAIWEGALGRCHHCFLALQDGEGTITQHLSAVLIFSKNVCIAVQLEEKLSENAHNGKKSPSKKFW